MAFEDAFAEAAVRVFGNLVRRARIEHIPLLVVLRAGHIPISSRPNAGNPGSAVLTRFRKK